MPLTAQQFPYTGPYYGPSHASGPDKGATAEALKRALSRLGYLEWTDFDRHYNQKLEDAVRRWQRDVSITPASGQYGCGSWTAIRAARVPAGGPHAGEYALDLYSRWIVQAEAQVDADSDDEARVQTRITEFCQLAISNEPNWHYSQRRPGSPLYVATPQSGTYYSDCSFFVKQAYDWAREKTRLPVPDPAKQGWTGYGNTDEFEDDHPKTFAPFRVGDLAHFHSERHVIICTQGGSATTAVWASHGRGAGPERVVLTSYSRYPGEFMFVVRPPLLEPGV